MLTSRSIVKNLQQFKTQWAISIDIYSTTIYKSRAISRFTITYTQYIDVAYIEV
jgi:hypothetical protein